MSDEQDTRPEWVRRPLPADFPVSALPVVWATTVDVKNQAMWLFLRHQHALTSATFTAAEADELGHALLGGVLELRTGLHVASVPIFGPDGRPIK